ncbi:hypothetical protein TanjilG_21727 [Lupinus angustifolius]|uniref:NAC domain-containing protein n=1 Tax=Lupinus angustifolius TaxID=3871 RepID=A0A1J7I2H2_LUPAN|nr:PREDICTED: NAC domain-containing protein 72-like [Lupinus angustifolius]OIW08261.1 hypothetical protein TanjilG_21727 [Lupinus angustifolius]
MGVPEKDPLAQLSLPPGFRFFPTDEELLVQYLCRKVAGHHFSLPIIAEIDLYKFDPWVLPGKAIFGEKEWYFFSPRDRKYPNGSRPNRVAGSGYWKATGTDKIITTEGRKVGIKKALVFYIGKAPKGTKTNWIMHEYRLLDSSRKNNGSAKLDDWVLCRIYKKNSSAQKTVVPSFSSTEYSNGGSSPSSSSHVEDMIELPEINDQFFGLPRMNSLRTSQQNHDGFQNLGSFSDWVNSSGLDSVPEFQTQGMVNYGENDLFVPSMPQFCHVDLTGKQVEEEVQSGLRNQRRINENSGYYQQNPNVFMQYNDSFSFGYPNQQDGFGFGK